MALAEPAQVELTKRYQTRLAAIRDRTAAAAAAAWDELGNYDEVDVARYAKRLEPAIGAARDATVSTSSGYYSTLGNVAPPAIDPATIAAAHDPRDPFISTWQALAAGHDYPAAVAAGRSRAEAAAGDYVQSTSRQTGDAVMAVTGQRIVGWRRVLTGKSCEWCRTVSTQRYKTAYTADFGHNRCDCSAVPIYGTSDPGRILNDTITSTGAGAAAAAQVKPFRAPRAVTEEVRPGIFVHADTPADFEAKHLADLDNVPDWVRTRVAAEGVEMHIVPGGMTDVFPEMRGTAPRGWPPGSTWDQVPGGYNDNARKAVAGAGTPEGSVGMAAHEFGHAVEHVLARVADDWDRLNPLEVWQWRNKALTIVDERADSLLPYYAERVGGAGASELKAETFAIFAHTADEANRLALIKAHILRGNAGPDRDTIAREIYDWMDGLWTNGDKWVGLAT